MIKLKQIVIALMAVFTLLGAPFQASARNRITIVNAEQAPSANISHGVLHELVRTKFELGSGPSVVSGIHVSIYGPYKVFDSLVAVSEEDTVRAVIDKNGVAVNVHDIKEKVVGRLKNLSYPSGFYGEFVVPVEDDLIQANGANKSYVIYGVVGGYAYNYGGYTISARVEYLDADENTEISWMYDVERWGNTHTIYNDWEQHSTVTLEAEQNIAPTLVNSTSTKRERVVLGSVSVDVDKYQVNAEDISFELWSTTNDPKLFKGLVNIQIVDGNGRMLPGTKPVKPQFTLAGNRVKVTFPGLKLYFDEGKTSLKFVGTFSAYDKSNPPLVTMVLKSQDWIWKDSFDVRIDVNTYFQAKTVVCPPIRFTPRGGPRG